MDIQKVSFAYNGYYGRVAVEEHQILPKLSVGMNRLYYIHDGWIDVALEKGTQRLEKGHLYLVPNTMKNTLTTSYVDHTCFNFFTFPRIRNSSIIDIPLANEPILEAHIHTLSLFVEHFPRIYRNVNRERMKYVTSSFRNLLFLINEKVEIIGSEDDLMENVIDYVHHAYTQKMTVTELAERFHLEEKTLIRRFKRATTMTPYHYIKLLRVNHAQELILEGERTLDEIARIVGYADAPTLSHAIKSSDSRLL